MKRTFFAITALLVLAAYSYQESQAQIKIIVVPSAKKVKLYDDEFEDMKTKTEALLDPSAFDNFRFKDKKTGKVLTYKELPDFHQKIFYIEKLEKLSKILHVHYDDLAADLVNLKKTEGQKRSDTLDAAANYLDVDHYKSETFLLRKNLAVEYKSVANSFFEKYSGKFTEEEAHGYIEQMRNYHNKQKLIERKK